MKKLIKRWLTYIGYYSKCCGERTVYNENWDITHCSSCGKRQ